MLDKVHSHEQAENVWIARKTLPTKMSCDQRKKSSRVRNFDPVIIHLHISEGSLLIVVSMGEGVYQCLTEYIERHFPLLCTRTCTFNLIFEHQLILKPAKSLFILGYERSTESLVINDMQLVGSLELGASDYSVEEQKLGMLVKKQNCATLNIAILFMSSAVIITLMLTEFCANLGSHVAKSACQLAGARCEALCECKVTHFPLEFQ